MVSGTWYLLGEALVLEGGFGVRGSKVWGCSVGLPGQSPRECSGFQPPESLRSHLIQANETSHDQQFSPSTLLAFISGPTSLNF